MKPNIHLLICALGGEGGGVLTEWLVEVARRAGHAVQATSIPGVAQRTGATTYYLETSAEPVAPGARQPVFSLYPVPGQIDALVSTELLETARQIGQGLASRERTLVITSSARTLTTAERMHGGDGRTDSHALLEVVREHARAHHVLDMSQLAQTAGTVASAVMLGAIAGSGLFPFARTLYEAVIGGGPAPSASAQASLRGFASAWDAVALQQQHADYLQSLIEGIDSTAVRPERHQGEPDMRILGLPAPVRSLAGLGLTRVIEFQDRDYGALYLARLNRIIEAERAGDPAASLGWGIATEAARWLALWMSFDDIIRVAELKGRASRMDRVRGEVKAGPDDLVRVFDHFKPGVAEFAGLMPPRLAQALLAREARRVAAGKTAWALPMKIASHGIRGALALRLLSAMRALRPSSSRWATEQALIDRWLAALDQATREHAPLGLEIARCGRLIKGYGATNERGKDNLLHLIDHLARPRPGGPDAPSRARAVAAARDAALADEGGKALDAALLTHGAPARPVKEAPIRWMHNPRSPKKA